MVLFGGDLEYLKGLPQVMMSKYPPSVIMKCTCSSSMGVRSPWCDVHFVELINELPLTVRMMMRSLCTDDMRDLFFLWNRTTGMDRIERFKSLAAGGGEVLEAEHS